MIEINLDPNLLHLGPLLITWHGFFSAVGLAIGIWLTVALASGSSITADDIYTIALAAVPGGIIGARLLFAIENWHLFANNPLGVLAINEGGISIYGAVIGGSLGGLISARFTKRPVPFIADRGAIGLIVGQGVGRIGDIINGEHHGLEAPDLSWSVTYTNPNTLGELGIPVHLAVGYELAYDLLAGLVLYWVLRRQPREGMTYVAYLFLYGLGRMWIGFFRKDTDVFMGLGMAQTLGLISMIVGGIWFLALLQGTGKKSTRAERRRGAG